MLLSRIKRMEESHKLLAEQAPAEVLDTLSQALEEARAELRATEPTAKRLQAMQQAVERKVERVGKIDARLAAITEEQGKLEPLLMAAIEKVRQTYRQQHQALEMEAQNLVVQKDNLSEALVEMRQQQRQLVPPDMTHEKLEESPMTVREVDMSSFYKVSNALCMVYPQCTHICEEVTRLAKEQYMQAQGVKVQQLAQGMQPGPVVPSLDPAGLPSLGLAVQQAPQQQMQQMQQQQPPLLQQACPPHAQEADRQREQERVHARKRQTGEGVWPTNPEEVAELDSMQETPQYVHTTQLEADVVNTPVGMDEEDTPVIGQTPCL
eukprot:6472238-Amphidinium_carterae.2